MFPTLLAGDLYTRRSTINRKGDFYQNIPFSGFHSGKDSVEEIFKWYLLKNAMQLNHYIFVVSLSVPANHRSISMLEITLVTFEINLQMVLLHVSPKVAIASHFLIAVKTLIQSVTIPFRKFDHGGN